MIQANEYNNINQTNRFSLNEFFKTKNNKNLLKINNVSTKLNGLTLLSIKKEILNEINYDNLINNFV